MIDVSFALISTAIATAAFVQGATSVGFALIVAPVLALLAPHLLPTCLLVLMVPLNAYFVWRERASIDRSGATWITGGRVVGTFGGLWVLAASAANLNLIVGGVTILAAAMSLVVPSFNPNRDAYLAVGVVTGITETATGIGGPPLALVYQHRPAATVRATIALCFLIGELISIALLAIAGHPIVSQIGEAVRFTPALVLGAVFSRVTHRHLNDAALRRFVLLFAVVSGCVLIARG